MKSPKEVIENIRKIRFGIGLNINETPEDIRAHIEDSKKFKDDAAILVSDLHTEKPHFILELIQNAEDNEYNDGVTPKLKFIIEEGQIILQNNEKGFEEKNVRALCGIGGSTKRDKSLGYIGEKGIGFKSVYRVTNNPRIFSKGFNFEFRYDLNKPVSIIIPYWVENIPPFINLNETNIILPLKEEVKKELSEYMKIDPRLILFLKKLKTIEIQDRIENKSRVIKLFELSGKVEIEHPTGKECYKIVKNSEPIKVPPEIREEKRKGVTETEIILAFPLNLDGSANTSIEQEIFVYLPVRSYGFRFIIQADFLLPPSREDIYKDKEWNKWLRDEVANVFLRAIDRFKQDENLKKTYYNFIPLANEVTDEFFSPLVSKIYSNLRESECILTESGNWLKPQGVFRADKAIRELISNEDLKKFFNKEYISSEINANKPILDALEVPEFKFGDLAQCLQKTEWLRQQSDEWFIRLYPYLNSQKLEKGQLEELKKLKILLLETNELASIIESPVFFPLDKKGDYGFEKELRILKRTIFELKEKEIKEAVIGFLKNIGVQDASPYEIIKDHTLPIYESKDDSSNWKSKDENVLLGYTRYIKDNLEKYEKESDKHLNGNKNSWESREDPLKRLKESLLIRINKTVDGHNYYHPENIYLPEAYGNRNNVESLFEGIEDIPFVHKEYIDDIIKKYRQAKRKDKKGKGNIQKKREEEIKEWREFFVKLGVNEGLKIEETDQTYLSLEEKSELRNNSYYSEEKVTDYTLKYLEQILEGLNKHPSEDKSKLLLAYLEKKYENLSKYIKLKYEWRYPYQRSWCSANADSFWLHLLKTTFWLPTSRGNLAKPSDVFLDKPEIRNLLGDSVPYLTVELKNDKFIKALGINSEANVIGVLNYLKNLSEQGCKDKNIFTKLYDFLNRNYGSNENVIKDAFSKNKIIYIPDNGQCYFSCKEVIWEDASDIFGENRGYLENHYSKLKSFFVDNLEVSEKPKPEDYANVLIDLTRKDKIEEKDGNIILKIYKELNTHLIPNNNEQLISEKWWPDFIGKPIFWTDKECWKNKNDVFISDNQELYELFKDNPKISFLNLPNNYHPQIQYLIKTVGISYLSKAVKIELASEETKNIEEDLTTLIQNSLPYILRYLYQLSNSDYEKLKNNSILTQLKNLKCYSVETLRGKYSIESEFVFAERSSLLYNGNLYIQKDNLNDIDHLAIELSKLFGDIRGLDDFLISLFEKKTREKIENLLRAKGIQELPDDEQRLFGITQHLILDGEVVSEKGEAKIIDSHPQDIVPVVNQIKTEVTTEKSKTQVHPSFISQQELKTEWFPAVKPIEVEPSINQFQTKNSVLNAKNDGLKEISIAIVKTQQISYNENEQNQDILSPETKKEIGKWGEEYSLECLKDKLSKKYSEGEVKETEDGFKIICAEKTLVEVHWLNKVEDNGIGYDIKVIENGNEEYIEVKSTKTDSNDWFEVSNKQWELMKREGDKFHLYRVYNAGTNEAKVIDIANPYKKWQEGILSAYPIRIQI